MPSIAIRTAAATLTCPPDKPQVYYTDTETKRLRLKVSRSGRHVWDWRTATQTEVLGVFDPTGNNGLSYVEAKGRADRLNLALNRGESVEAAAADPAPVNTVGELFDHYLAKVRAAGKREHHDKETARGIESNIKPLLARHGGLPVVEFTKHLLMKVVEDAGLSGRVAGVKLIKTYRAAWNYCQRDNVLPPFDRNGASLKNPASFLVRDEPAMRVKSRGSYKTSLTDEQIVALLRAIETCKGAWDNGRRARIGLGEIPKRHPMGYLAAEFLLYTGCRKSEAQRLRTNCLRGDTAIIAEHKTDHTGEARIIHLTPLAKRALADAEKLRAEMRYTGPLAFPSINGKEIAAIDDYLATACEIAGIRRLVPHSLRSIYINFSVRSGTPLEVASRNVGHESIRTTREHYEVIEQALRAQHASAASAALERLLVEAGQTP